MIEVPNFIKGPNTDKRSYNIPKHIIQTYKDNLVHTSIHDNIKRILRENPDYDYYLVTDATGRSLISRYFNRETLAAYDKLNIGAAKGDFLRYVSIYIYGGVYIDLDSTITDSLNKSIDNNMDHYIVYDDNFNIMNTPIISKPRNPIILNVIEETVKRINEYEANIFLATGPTLVTDVIYREITNKDVYDTKTNTTSAERHKIWSQNTHYKNGKIVRESDIPEIKFCMPNYNNAFLYPDNDKYSVTFNTPTLYLYKYIHIGSSVSNTKTVKLDKCYASSKRLVFLHEYKDTFSYKFSDDVLTIRRTDKLCGWGQDLLAYL